MKVELLEFASRLYVGGKERAKDESKVFSRRDEKDKVATEMGKTMRGARFGGEMRSSLLKHPSGNIKLTTRCVNLKFKEEVQIGNVNLGVIRIFLVFKNTSMDFVTK